MDTNPPPMAAPQPQQAVGQPQAQPQGYPPQYPQQPGNPQGQQPVYPPQGQYPQQQQPYPSQPMYPHSYPQQQFYAPQPPQTEEFILLPNELHLGNIKETFRRGTVITHDITNRRLIVDGRIFENTRDIDVLKRQAMKNPQRPWVIPFSEEARAEILGIPANPQAAPLPPRQEFDNMPVVAHDTSEVEPIPIAHTRVAANNAAEAQARRQAVRDGAPMEIIRGDEGVEERIRRLEGKNDIGSIAERARLKAARAAKMPVIRDDSLGHMGGSRATSLNAGQPLPSREQAEAAKADALAIAASRKQQAEQTRQASGMVMPPYPAQATASQPHQQALPPQQPYPPQQPQAPAQVDVPDAAPQGVPGLYDEVSPLPMDPPAPPAPAAPTAEQQRIAALEGDMGELKEGVGQIMGFLQNMQQAQAPAPAEVPNTTAVEAEG